MPDIATLGVRVQQTGAEQVTAQLNAVGAAGQRAGASVVGAMTPVSESFMNASISAAQLARSGAEAETIARMTGVSMASAAYAVDKFGANAATAAVEAQGLAVAQREATAASVELEAATASSGLQLGRLRQSFATLSAETLGVNPIFGRLSSTMAGAFGLGSVVVIGVLAGISAIGAAYNYFTKEAREAQKAQDDLTASLVKWYQTKERGPAGERDQGIAATQALIAQQQAEINKLLPTLGAGGVIAGSVNRDRIAELRTEIAKEQQIIAAASVDVTQTLTESFLDQNKAYGQALADRLRYNAKDEDARKQGLAQLKADQELYAQYIKLPLTGSDGALHGSMTSSMAGQIETLQNALFPPADDRNDAAQIDDIIKRFNAQGEAAQKAAGRIKKAAAEAADAAERVALNNAIYINKVRDALKPAPLSASDPVAIDMANIAAATKKAMEDQKTIVETALKDEQRTFSDFFYNIFTKGTASFRNLFDNIRDLFFKMVAEVAAADLMKKIAGPMSAVIGAMLGMPSTANAQSGWSGNPMPGGIMLPSTSTAAKVGAGAMIAGAGFGFGSMFGGFAQQHGLGEVGAGLGGAAGGAALGAGIGMMGGPIGVAAGALIGGLAGAAGGLLGFTHSAGEAAKALLAFQTAEAGVTASLADWRAQITGTAADQKAAALLDLQVKYDQMQQTINQTLAGKKHESERNLELAQAKDLYDKQRTAIENNTQAWQQNTGAINTVQGYRYESLYYGSMPVQRGSNSTPAPAGTTDKQPIVIQNVMVLDGKVVAKSVLKTFQDAARRSIMGDPTRWPEISTVT